MANLMHRCVRGFLFGLRILPFLESIEAAFGGAEFSVGTLWDEGTLAVETDFGDAHDFDFFVV